MAIGAGILAQSAFAAPPPELDALGHFTHWYPDETALQPDAAEEPGDPALKDVIGGQVFDTQGLAAGWKDGVLHLALVSRFPNSQVFSAGRNVAPADLALDLDRNGTFETGIVLSSIRSTGDKGIERRPDLEPGKAYFVDEWYKPGDILEKTYGASWHWQGPDGTLNDQGWIPVWIKSGRERTDLNVEVTWHALEESGEWAVLVTIAYPEKPRALWYLPLVWGTAVCGNDVVFAQVARWPDAPVDNLGPVDYSGPGIGLPSWNAAPVPLLLPPLPGQSLPGGNAGGQAAMAVAGGANGGGQPITIYDPPRDPIIDAGGGGEPVAAVPVPPTAFLLAGAIALLLRLRRRVR